MGTTILSLRYNGGVIVGADTRTSAGGYVSNRYASKITFILDKPSHEEARISLNDEQSPTSTCCVCRSGSAADTQHLAQKATEELLARNMLYSGGTFQNTVVQTAYLLRALLVSSNGGVSASLICAGYDHPSKMGKIFSISPSGMIMEEKDWAVSGSGSTYILGYLDENYPERENGPSSMDEKSALDIVGKAIELAMDRDGSSGGFIRMYAIDSNGKRAFFKMPNGPLTPLIGEETSLSFFVPGMGGEGTSKNSYTELENFAPPKKVE